ncbi:lipopolysaccharide assembly protein LapA domain-containing protein [Idiomarina xiamenensis]|uniref:Lipopolysaccharide assembly protein A domain-containing protein n=1 Tax=Idiomarina xiamenensis 10-D-4 TaxID=740709 RepID=K2JU14_9GAMM|nr:LapA family protein [Idiomarina xiamenensis]EKE86936.1 hypothetical protein A10D4_01802 [Idiomarina xiamenensis 10-D-4]
MLRVIFTYLPLAVVFVLALAFGAQNDAQVEVNFFIVKQQLSVTVLLGLFVAFGFIFGVLAMLTQQLRLRMANRQLRKRIATLERPKPSSSQA